jgi:peptidoglycan pentaglycine glycine transferase (the first glycine)
MIMVTENDVNKKTWTNFVKKNGPESGRFLHSFEWGEFQKETGVTVRRFVWKKKDVIEAVAQVAHRRVKFFGVYDCCSRGPIVSGNFKMKVEELKKIFPSSSFFRFEQLNKVVIKKAKKVSEIQPAHTLITDLSDSEELLLKNMHQKTRYNIRVAMKKKVRVAFQSVSFREAWELFEDTSKRGEFRLHGKEYYEKMLNSLGVGECKAFLATAWHDDDLLAANIMIDFDGTRTYLHGASSNKKRNMMGPYLLHFELMKDAKVKGLKFYDWWGVAPEGAAKSHSWSGISRFKRGFGGKEVEYLGTYDLPLKPLTYYLYRLAKLIRR